MEDCNLYIKYKCNTGILRSFSDIEMHLLQVVPFLNLNTRNHCCTGVVCCLKTQIFSQRKTSTTNQIFNRNEKAREKNAGGNCVTACLQLVHILCSSHTSLLLYLCWLRHMGLQSTLLLWLFLLKTMGLFMWTVSKMYQ